MAIKIGETKVIQKALDQQAMHEQGCKCKDYNLATLELNRIGEEERMGRKAQLFCQNCKKYRYVVTIMADEVSVESLED
jgi:hypothetical protein